MKNFTPSRFVASALCLSALTLLAGLASSANAQVIYSTGWEADEAAHPWSTGNISGQNGWQNQNAASGHQVVGTTTVTNGSSTTTVTPLTGSQMHKSTASSSPNITFNRLAYNDFRNQWAARDAGNNVCYTSLDVFMPSAFATSTDEHGVTVEDVTVTGGPRAIGQVLFRPSDQSLDLLSYNSTSQSNQSLALVKNAFSYDQWFHLDFYVNLDTQQLTTKINGIKVASGTFDGTAGVFSSIGDVALTNVNHSGGSSAFTDNYRVSATTPAPQSVAILAIGLGGLPFVVRRRKK